MSDQQDRRYSRTGRRSRRPSREDEFVLQIEIAGAQIGVFDAHVDDAILEIIRKGCVIRKSSIDDDGAVARELEFQRTALLKALATGEIYLSQAGDQSLG